jgi:hypothetical protein
MPSSAAGQCGTTSSCDTSVPLSDISLAFSSSTAGEESGIEMSMLVTIPINENQTIDVGLPGFTAPDFSGIQLDTAVFKQDPLFFTNIVSPMPPWTLLGCINDDLTTR